MKRIKLLVCVLCLVMCASVIPVMAGGNVVENAKNVAYETLGAQRDIPIGSPRMVLGNSLTTGNIMYLYLSGPGGFRTNGTYYLCSNSATNTNMMMIGSGSAPSSSTLALSINVAAVNYSLSNASSVYLYGNHTTGTCDTAANLVFPAQAAVGTTTLSGNVLAYGSPWDSLAGNNIAKVVNQFTTTITSAELIEIDYLGGARNGSTLVAGASNLLAMSSNKLTATNNTTEMIYSVGSLGGAYNQVLTISDSQGWTGIRNVYVGQNGACSSNLTAAVNAPTSGNITLNIPTYTSTPSAIITTTLCVNVAGNVVLPSRAISGSYAYVVSGATPGLLTPAGGATATWQTWVPNGYQAFNPYMYVGTADGTHADDVFVRLYNNSIYTANVYVDVYPADGTDSQRLVLTNIAPNTAGLYWAADIGAAAGLAYGTSYAAQFTVTAPKDQVNGVSFMKRAAGERQMPLYKSVNGARNYLTE